MPGNRILHIDLDAFFCAVEAILNPSLNGLPFAVGGSSDRGVVTSCSYEARKFGVRSAMPMARAKQLCPQLISVSSSRNMYGLKSKEVMTILKKYSDKVEQISIDEAFLDISSIPTHIHEQLAKNIQDEIFSDSQLPSSIGISSNKLVAKIANDFGKSSSKHSGYPMSIFIIPEGGEQNFLSPLPIEMLWGVGPKTAERLEAAGVRTIGQLANWPINDLVFRFGDYGYSLANKAKGIDSRRLETQRKSKSVSSETTFYHDISNKKELLNKMKNQAERVSKSLQKTRMKGSTVKIKIRWSDFSTITRQITIEEPTNDSEEIFDACKKLFDSVWKNNYPVRLIGVGVSNFASPDPQLGLWDEKDWNKKIQIDSTLTDLQKKFGEAAIQKGLKK